MHSGSEWRRPVPARQFCYYSTLVGTPRRVMYVASCVRNLDINTGTYF